MGVVFVSVRGSMYQGVKCQLLPGFEESRCVVSVNARGSMNLGVLCRLLSWVREIMGCSVGYCQGFQQSRRILSVIVRGSMNQEV